jgi:hypothetical protein
MKEIGTKTIGAPVWAMILQKLTALEQKVDSRPPFVYEVVNSLPTASASTMNKLYFVPANNPGEANIKDEYITVATTSGNTTTYSWEKVGSTAVDVEDVADVLTGIEEEELNEIFPIND